MAKILISGIAGFVGKNLYEQLKENHTIYGLDRTNFDKLDENHMYINEIDDYIAIEKMWQEVKPDYLIHLAAIVHKNNADTSQTSYDRINYESSKHLFDLCKVTNTKVIFSSTIEVYGKNEDEDITEETKTQPLSYYAISKLKAEQELIDSGLKYTILRFAPLYGSEFTLNVDKRVFLLKDKMSYYFKDGSYNFTFCSIKNVCESVEKIIEHKCDNEIYIIADDQNISSKEIIDYYKQLKRVKVNVRMPYNLCKFAISCIEKILGAFSKKDIYLSKRNFEKLFISKRYNNNKFTNKYGSSKYNLYNTLGGK